MPSEHFGFSADVMADNLDSLIRTVFRYLIDTTFVPLRNKKGRVQPAKTLSMFGVAEHVPKLYRHTKGRMACISSKIFEDAHRETKFASRPAQSFFRLCARVAHKRKKSVRSPCSNPGRYQRNTMRGAAIAGRLNQHQEVLVVLMASKSARLGPCANDLSIAMVQIRVAKPELTRDSPRSRERTRRGARRRGRCES